MKNILIVEKETLKVLGTYRAEKPSIEKWGGLHGDSSKCEHMVCPHVLDPECVKVILDQLDNMMVVEDEERAALKKKAAWEILRAERVRRLAESDWTQVVDAPLSSQDKTAWQKYRQALRDMPENTSDPEKPQWPKKPDPQI